MIFLGSNLDFRLQSRQTIPFDSGAVPIAAGVTNDFSINIFTPNPRQILGRLLIRIAFLSAIVIESGIPTSDLDLLGIDAIMLAGNPGGTAQFAVFTAAPNALPLGFGSLLVRDAYFFSSDMANLVPGNLTEWQVQVNCIVRNRGLFGRNFDLLGALTFEEWFASTSHLGYP